MSSAETFPIRAERWGQRHPRLVALLVTVVAGSGFAFFTASLIFIANPNFYSFGLFLNIERNYVISASIWAYIFFGGYIRHTETGPWRAILAGFSCVMLSLMTWPLCKAIYDAIFYCRHGALGCLDSFFWHQMWFGLWFEIGAGLFFCLYMAFLPQLIGALGGLFIWEVIKSESS